MEKEERISILYEIRKKKFTIQLTVDFVTKQVIPKPTDRWLVDNKTRK